MSQYLILVILATLSFKSCQPCGFVTDLQTAEFQLEETATPGEASSIVIQVSPDVRKIDFTGSEGLRYLDFVLDRTTSKIHAIPKDTLATFFDAAESDMIQIPSPKLKCSGGSEFVSIHPLEVKVVDVNDKPPEFEPLTEKSFNIQLPYKGVPINWNQVIKVRDADVTENNTRLQFYAEPSELVQIIPNPPVRVMADGRLVHYEVYFGLEEGWEAPGVWPVTIMATDGIHYDSVTLELNITRGPDVQRPSITEDRSYHGKQLTNTVGESVPVATIVDDADATQDLFIWVQGKFGRKFGVVVNGTSVTLQLKRGFTPEQLAETNHLVRVTLLATDAAGNSAGLPLAFQFNAPACQDGAAAAADVKENEISPSEDAAKELVADGIHLTLTTDQNDAVTSIGANLSGEIKEKFDIAMQTDGTVLLKLKDDYLDRSMELLDNEWLVRLTMTITDDADQLTPRQQRELSGGKKAKIMGDEAGRNGSQNLDEPQNPSQDTDPILSRQYAARNFPSQYSGPNVGGQSSGQIPTEGQYPSRNLRGQPAGQNFGGQQPNLGDRYQSQNLGTRYPSQNVGREYPVQNVGGQYPSQNVGGQYPGQNVGGQYPGQNVGGQYPGQNVGGQNIGGQYPGQNIGGQYPSQNIGGQNPSQNIGGQYPSQNVVGSQYPNQNAGGQRPSQSIGGRYPNQNVGDIDQYSREELGNENFGDRLQNAGGQRPSQNIGGQYPSQPIGGQYPSQNSGGQYPSQKIQTQRRTTPEPELLALEEQEGAIKFPDNGDEDGAESQNYNEFQPPTEFTCTGEGFFADTSSCTKFHRCVYNGLYGRYQDYKMDCPPGVDLWCQSTLSCSFSYQCPERCTVAQHQQQSQF